ncbi:hypothetical protein HMPREF0454_01185 [Hafnia alvei ATCC 51873]|uniref:Uncharacterized protein n=1 Tax=Hafnia alvei ATCC 51873 TaxID=1002364 RepID=G9Y3Q5_HAFAL|nr:hypothetical protein HMPREF0454_01185 [Hafnia alvei ATCC 51873]
MGSQERSDDSTTLSQAHINKDSCFLIARECKKAHMEWARLER